MKNVNATRFLQPVLFGTLALGTIFGCSSSTSRVSSEEETAGDLRYLAVGDSISFGENSFIPYTPEARRDPNALVGFADILGKESFEGKYLNMSCPGETSGSFLDENAPNLGCQKYARPLGLKHNYQGSQVAEMVRLIKANPKLELITFTLGGNDFFMLTLSCKAKANGDKQAFTMCMIQGGPDLQKNFLANIDKIAKSAREAGFTGKFVGAGFYSTDYRDFIEAITAADTNTKLTAALAPYNGVVAKTNEAFQAKAQEFGGATCATGLLIKNPSAEDVERPCDHHPSEAGARVIVQSVLEAIK